MSKFRSWNEKCEMFYYFRDGYYYTFNPVDEEYSRHVPLMNGDKFNWKNAEQEIFRNGVTFFEGDKYKINDSLYGVIAIANGILGFKKYKTSSDEYIGFFKISQYSIQSMNKLGNIHEDKEV